MNSKIRNDLVYESHGLTEGEIKNVESSQEKRE
jgi:hypothetical protein